MKGFWGCCFIFFCCQAFAQTSVEKIKFSKIELHSELSNSRVTSILQDSRGFIWVATEDGLNRFDGYEFKVYRNLPNDTTSLLKNSILNLYEDSRGILWISTSNGGLHTYNIKQDNFERIKEYNFNCEIGVITEDKDYIWIGGVKSHNAFIDRLDKISHQWKRSTLFRSENPTLFISRDAADEFWIGVRNIGFFKWNEKTNSVKKYSADKNNRNTIIHNGVHQIIRDPKGYIWIATEGGVSKFEIATGKFKNYSKALLQNHTAPLVDNTLSLCMDGDYIWIGTENGGLSQLDTRTDNFKNFSNIKNDPSSLPDNSVWVLYKDRQGRIWIGMYSKGLCVIDRMKDKFSELDIPLENDVVNAIWQDSKKRFWVGTENGIAMKDGSNVHYFNHSENNPNSLSSNPILSILEDSKQQMWFGTWAGGLNRFDEVNNRFITYKPDSERINSMSDANVFAIAQLKESGKLLAGTYKGLNILQDEKRGIFTNYRSDKFEYNNYIRTIHEDSEGNVWIGTIEDLALFDPHTQKIVSFNTSMDPNFHSVGGLVNCIVEDKKRRLWVGTNNGLYLIINKKYSKRYTIESGLKNDIVYGILEDNSGNLWLSTAEGISKFNPETNKFKYYDVNDGLLSNEFKANVCFKNDEGQFFFGGKGVNVFYPDSIKDNPYIPPVYITDLKLFNQSVKVGDKDGILTQQISEAFEVSLSPEYNFFTINYVALNYTAPTKNQYAYKLEGFDDTWNYVGDQRSVTFTNLDPGYYIFKVKASNNDGLWNEEGTLLIIRILPPWWETWWFRSLASIIIISVVMGTYKVRVSRITQQNRKLEDIVERRTRELAHQNEELLQIQQQISAQRDLVSEQNMELQYAREIIEKQNDEIILRNETLEAEVEERTRDLVEYNQQLEQFAFISAHNLRAPVARILGLGNVLGIIRNDPNEVNMIIDRIMFTTEELDRVVKDLNTVLELRKDNTSVITRINLADELKLVKINLEKEIEETHTVFEEDFSNAAVVYTLKPYLDSILMNLISNAIKYRNPNIPPVIRIQSQIVQEHICITVSDNGLGMDLPLYRDKLFTLYSRFHSHVEGKGMGLYLVKTQATALGGKIEVESQTGNGTTFKVYIRNQTSA
ncbi:sensor histidine kinase [Ohtaekwangia koreensis]|uniref:histidine kinase n=1 Tax=Ohtaekwangia koreensis TaxID=688867 RepID=A0A1T5MG65_9BACT|nr:sensor histidine kinase [Ohtaekwangia koreensis]SKC87202.1 Signal transduction histidine kinase [Ohtaekwangia koreensis]